MFQKWPLAFSFCFIFRQCKRRILRIFWQIKRSFLLLKIIYLMVILFQSFQQKRFFLDSNLEVFQVELSNLLRGQTSNNTDACNVTTMFREIIENHSQEQGFTGRNRLKGQWFGLVNLNSCNPISLLKIILCSHSFRKLRPVDTKTQRFRCTTQKTVLKCSRDIFSSGIGYNLFLDLFDLYNQRIGCMSHMKISEAHG